VLVLVCPTCSEVLPDREISSSEAPPFEFPPPAVSDENPPENSTKAPVVRDEHPILVPGAQIEIVKIIVFLIVLSIVFWALAHK